MVVAGVSSSVSAAAAHPRQQAAGQHPTRTQEHAQPHYPVSGRPYLIYGSVTSSAIPAHQEVATYANGNYVGSPAQVAAYTPTGQDAPGWWPSAGANRLGRQVGRFQMRALPRQEYGKLSYAGG